MTLLAALLLACLPLPAAADGAAFDNIAYIGDPGACKMDAQMALAYAEVIESLPTSQDNGNLYVTLADFADDGYPILITMYTDETTFLFGNVDLRYVSSPPTFWGYKDGAAYQTEISWSSYGKLGGKGMVYSIYGNNGPMEPSYIHRWYYTVSHGQIELAHDLEYYVAGPSYRYEGDGKLGGTAPEGATYVNPDRSLDESRLAENGWIKGEDGSWDLIFDNGENVTRKYLDEGLDSILGATPNVEGTISYLGEGLPSSVIYIDCSPAADVSAALRVYAESAGGPSAPAYTALSGIAYVGDRAKCNMDAQMALAYAEVIAGLPATALDEYEGTGTLHAALVDYAGDGWPILLTVYRTDRAWFDLNFWGYQNGSAYKADPGFDNDFFDYFFYGELNGNTTIVKLTTGQSVGDLSLRVFYTISHGQITMTHAIVDYYGFTSSDDPGIVLTEDFVDFLPNFTVGAVIETENRYGRLRYTLDSTKLEENGWSQSGRDWTLTLDNGKPTTESPISVSEYKGFIAENSGFSVSDPEIIDTTPASAATNVLRSYAQRASGYSYPRPTVDEDKYVQDIVELVKSAFGTDDVTVYKLGDGLYLVVVVIDGGRQAALVEGRRVKGKVEWEIMERYPELPAEEELEPVVIGRVSTPNIDPDFRKIPGFKNTGDVWDYIKDLFDNMPGVTPNDAGKNRLGSFIEESISGLRLVTVSVRGSRVTIDGDSLGSAVKDALRDRDEIEDRLEEEGVRLNKPITIILLVVWRGTDLSEPCQITLDKSLVDALHGCDLRVIAGDERHYIQLSAQRLEALVERYGALMIQLSRLGENRYVINFLGEDETLLEELIEPVTVGLPAAGYTSTVMVSYAGRSENWGGQYDPAAGVISFDTRYSGQTEVIDNAVAISDVSGLPEDVQKAISFMVSKGYMSAPEGSFDPDAPLSRYAFTQALTGMFFALDHSMTCSFPDVPEDSPYYAYVASAEAQNIVTGFDDGAFRGDNGMTVEQMLALAARTLIDKKGYIEPDDPESYLSSFSDGESVSAWALAQVAMSVRDGIKDRGGTLDPQGDITKAQAADILYRLFLLLYDAPPVALELPDELQNSAAEPLEDDESAAETEADEEGGIPVVAIACAAGGILAVGGGAAWYLIKKKKTKTKIE